MWLLPPPLDSGFPPLNYIMKRLKEILSSLSGDLETRYAEWKGIALVALTAAIAVATVAIACAIIRPPVILLALAVAAMVAYIK